jgi:N-acetylneuraminate synthase/sialic acid synthase
MKFFNRDLDRKPVIIAEVGQNHQGDLKIAKNYIKTFSELGADIIKFQSRDNKILFDKISYDTLYLNRNSFGKTYGEHREKLELSKKGLKILVQECKKYKVGFMCTPFEEKSLNLICNIGAQVIKVASFDLGNLPFLNKIGMKRKPVVLSVGGGNDKQIDESVKILIKHNIKIILLHCVSEYPCAFDRLDLKKIKKLKKKYPGLIVGSSDHYNGVLSGPLAYLQGARVFEKHVTFNRSWKGSDHNFALEPDGFKKFVRDIYRTPLMLKSKPISEIGKEIVFNRLGKSLIANKNINKGDKLTLDNLSGKIFSKQYTPVRDSFKVIGKTVKITIEKDSPIFMNMLK